MSGPPLGRPPANVSKEKKKQDLQSESIRNCIEGKFGQGKRRFSLNRVMTKLSHTSQTAIAITFLVAFVVRCMPLFLLHDYATSIFIVLSASANWHTVSLFIQEV